MANGIEQTCKRIETPVIYTSAKKSADSCFAAEPAQVVPLFVCRRRENL